MRLGTQVIGDFIKEHYGADRHDAVDLIAALDRAGLEIREKPVAVLKDQFGDDVSVVLRR